MHNTRTNTHIAPCNCILRLNRATWMHFWNYPARNLCSAVSAETTKSIFIASNVWRKNKKYKCSKDNQPRQTENKQKLKILLLMDNLANVCASHDTNKYRRQQNKTKKREKKGKNKMSARNLYWQQCSDGSRYESSMTHKTITVMYTSI